MKNDDRVGYGLPPKHSRFKKGQSGNPKGRPKRKKSFPALIKKELAQKITVKENGRTLQLSKQEAIAKTVVAKAVTGDIKSLQWLMEHAGPSMQTDGYFVSREEANDARETIKQRYADIARRLEAAEPRQGDGGSSEAAQKGRDGNAE